MFKIKLERALFMSNECVGLRVSKDGVLYDVELDVLTKFTLRDLQLKREFLVPHGDIMATEYEIRNGISVEDMSGNPDFVRLVNRAIESRLSPYNTDGFVVINLSVQMTKEKDVFLFYLYKRERRYTLIKWDEELEIVPNVKIRPIRIDTENGEYHLELNGVPSVWPFDRSGYFIDPTPIEVE